MPKSDFYPSLLPYWGNWGNWGKNSLSVWLETLNAALIYTRAHGFGLVPWARGNWGNWGQLGSITPVYPPFFAPETGVTGVAKWGVRNG